MATSNASQISANSEQQRVASFIELSEVGEVRVISFRRDERGQVAFDIVRAYFASQMLEQTHAWPRLVLDLSGVPALDSAALGPLVQKLRETQENRGKLVLTGVEAPALREIFALTRFDRVFTILPTRSAAIAAAAT